MSKGRITLLGGTGFIGTELACHLAQQFDEVILLSRHTQRSRSLRILPNVHVVKTDIHDAPALQNALKDSDVVINLVGILNSAGSQSQNSFMGAHADLTASAIKACETAGVTRYLHVSALNADAENGSSEYLRSKGVAENHIKAAKKLDWTLFQPSVVFGEQDQFFNRFSQLLTSLPLFPLACPDSKMAPVFVGDVCKSIVNSLDDASTIGKTIKLVGPADFTLQEIVEYTAELRGLNRKIIRLPDGLAKLQARIMEFVPGKPFSVDNYQSLQTDSICDDCERQTTSVKAVVPRYIGNKACINGRLQSRREMARR